MHENFIQTSAKKAYSNGVGIITDRGGDELDTDQIMTILMAIRENSARRDEQLQSVSVKLDKLLLFNDGHVKEVDTALAEIRKRDSEFERRLSAIEGKGLAGWSAKRLAQWGGLIVLAGAVFATANKLWQWFLTRLQ